MRKGRRLVAIEVKSGRRRDSLPGLDLFARRHPAARRLLVGEVASISRISFSPTLSVGSQINYDPPVGVCIRGDPGDGRTA